jgi:redox-sensitive bicupin YhaK (pirin superfamily)
MTRSTISRARIELAARARSGHTPHMTSIRRAEDRGHAQHGWLDSHHSFSFAEYYDPQHMGFRALRVINEDRVAAGQGFGAHPHRDMEIISYVLEGALQHRDSLGTGSVIRPGDVQRMSAGTGVTHSEFNASESEPVHFLQIWLVPSQRGIRPSYEQKSFSVAERRGRLRVVAAPDARDGSLELHADAVVYCGLFDAGESAELPLAEGRHAWVQVARGKVRVDGTELNPGDGLSSSESRNMRIEGVEAAELLVFELA